MRLPQTNPNQHGDGGAFAITDPANVLCDFAAPCVTAFAFAMANLEAVATEPDEAR